LWTFFSWTGEDRGCVKDTFSDPHLEIASGAKMQVQSMQKVNRTKVAASKELLVMMKAPEKSSHFFNFSVFVILRN
jgi:hypothetical protein